MPEDHGTFFTSIGCMDGRVQEAIARYGKERFGAQFPDTITEAGLDGLLAKTEDQNLLDSTKKKLLISVEKHNSLGIIVHGHEDCAGNPVNEEQHKEDIKKSVEKIENMVEGRNIDVVGVYVRVQPQIQAEEVA